MNLSRRETIKLGLATIAGTVAGCNRGSAPAAHPTAEAPIEAATDVEPSVIRFAHVTDTHLDLGGPLTLQNMERLVEVIGNDHEDLDFVLFGGDNFNNNRSAGEDAVRFKHLIDGLSCPCYAVRGNKESHTASEANGYSQQSFRDLFGEGVIWSGRDWKLEIGSTHTVLGIDSTIDGQDNGLFTEASFEFVEAELRAAPERLFVMLNHHPYQDFWGAETDEERHRYVLGNADQVRQRLFAYDNLILTLSGHKHLDNRAEVSGTIEVATLGFIVRQDPDDPGSHGFRIVELRGGDVVDRLVTLG